MSRPQKTGIDYFPLDIDIFQDPKIEYISALFGSTGEAILIRLLCQIYRNGYYIEFDDDFTLVFAKRVGLREVTSDVVDEIIKALLKKGFFSEHMFAKHQILTSKAIQMRYLQATTKRSGVNIAEEYDLTEDSRIVQGANIPPQAKGQKGKKEDTKPEKIVSVEKTGVSSVNNPVVGEFTVEETPQRKVQERKESYTHSGKTKELVPLSKVLRDLAQNAREEEGWQRILQTYPKHRIDYKHSEIAYFQLHPSAADIVLIISHIEAWKTSPQWNTGGKRYVPNLSKFLLSGYPPPPSADWKESFVNEESNGEKTEVKHASKKR